MQDNQTPTKVPAIFANSAGGSYVTSPFPTASQISIKNGAASWNDGFPPNCFIALSAGGAGPFGADYNAVLQILSANAQWNAAGGPWYYDSAFSTNIGGYPKGAILANASTLGLFWISLVDNNATDPDTGGAGWVSIGIRRRLSADTTLYVNGTLPGVDSLTTGFTSGAPFATLNYALNLTQTMYDLAGHTLTISTIGAVGPAMVGGTVVGSGGAGSLVISASSATTIVGTSAANGLYVYDGFQCSLTGNITVSATGSGSGVLALGAGSQVIVGTGVTLGAAGLAALAASYGGLVVTGGTSPAIAATVGGDFLALAYGGGKVWFANDATVTFTGSPTYSVAILGSQVGSLVDLSNAVFTGTVTGAPLSVTDTSLVNVGTEPTTTFYVDGTSGIDQIGQGVTATTGAFNSLQYAWNWARNCGMDVNGANVVFSTLGAVGPVTMNGPIKGQSGRRGVQIVPSGTTTITATLSSGIVALDGAQVYLNASHSFTITATGSSTYTVNGVAVSEGMGVFAIGRGSVIEIAGADLAIGACTGWKLNSTGALILADAGSTIAFSGNGDGAITSGVQGSVYLAGSASFAGTYSVATAYCTVQSLIVAAGATLTGSPSGTAFIVEDVSLITGSSGIPGSTGTNANFVAATSDGPVNIALNAE